MRADGADCHRSTRRMSARRRSSLCAEGVESIAVCFLHAYAYPDARAAGGRVDPRATRT